AVIAMDHTHRTPHRPLTAHAELGEVFPLGADRLRQAHTHRNRRRLLESDVDTRDHAAVDIDRQRDPGTSDWPAMHLIHEDDVRLGMIDLDHGKWMVCTWEGALDRLVAIARHVPKPAAA